MPGNQRYIYMKKAVIYARVSSLGNRQNTQRQVDDLIQYASLHNYEILEVFEEHISGIKKNNERLVLCKCLDYCVTHKVDTLLISELSRLGRNVDELLSNVRFCKDNNLNIYFQKESLNIFNEDGSENPFLTIMLSVLGTCSFIEREAILFRLNSGRKRAIANGVRMGKPKGSLKTKERKKEEYKEVISLLKRGISIRNTAKIAGCGISTVQRLKKEFLL